MIPTFHPAAILHGGGERSRQFELLRDDFQLVRRTLDELAQAATPPRRRRCPATARRRAAGEPIVDVPDADQLELF